MANKYKICLEQNTSLDSPGLCPMQRHARCS